MNPRNYLLVGAGGTGSLLFPALTRYLETIERTEGQPFRLSVIDGKSVSATNLERQLFFGRFVTQNKAQALVEQYESDPSVIIAIPQYLGAEHTDAAIQENDTVLIAADNWPIRANIEARCKNLNNVIVINGGNELTEGSTQIWVRRAGVDITPPLSQGHPEILLPGEDLATMSCQQISELPGGGQTITANMMSAVAMLNAITHVHRWEKNPTSQPTWNEVFFDLNTYSMRTDAR